MRGGQIGVVSLVACAPTANAYGLPIQEVPSEIAQAVQAATGTTISSIDQSGLPTALPVRIRVSVAMPLAEARLQVERDPPLYLIGTSTSAGEAD